ncbi:MAG: YsnF/AvaK domain-containing protein, partial [Amnibacterium sp.]
VRTGLFGASESLVPLENANWDREMLHVGYDKSQVKDAPRVEADRELSPEEQEQLYSYYGLSGGAGRTGTTGMNDTTGMTGTTGLEDRGMRDADATGFDTTRTGAADMGRDTSGPNTDDAMTRSEERLNVGTERVQTGKARLRKYVVTEQQNVTVPVTREEVRVEREPITDANRGAAMDGPDLSEEQHEVVLNEERPVVDKETVPVERVRLSKEQVTDQQNVSADVRREEIETDGDATGRI